MNLDERGARGGWESREREEKRPWERAVCLVRHVGFVEKFAMTYVLPYIFSLRYILSPLKHIRSTVNQLQITDHSP